MKKYVRVNERIFAKTVRVIGPNGEQVGILPREQALAKAEEYSLDLVEVAPQATPPVCRIMDFSKYKYEQEKREKEARKHQKQTQLKEIRITPRISDHDYQVKLDHIKEFLQKKHKVRVRVMFKGRELFSHKDRGERLIDKLLSDVRDVGKVDKSPKLVGNSIVVLLSPNKAG